MRRFRGYVAALTVLVLLLVSLAGARTLRARPRGGDDVAAPPPQRAPAASWHAPSPKIPRDHPRLWWNPERLARGRAWAAHKDLHPRDDDRIGQALSYLLKGDKAEGRRAVDWLLGFTFSTEGVASDPARWQGESAFLIFDWCHDLLTDAQRKLLIDRWNGYLETLDRKEWGGVGMESNNYYWGYFRNGVEWGIASAYENPKAEERLTFALETRFARSFAPYAARAGRGGVLTEGAQYGPYIPAYAAVPFVSAADAGIDLWDATSFFREMIFYLIYATTPAPTASVYRPERLFELFPFDDDEKFRDDPGAAAKPYLATFVLAAAERWRNQPVGQYAQAWLELVEPQFSDMALAWRGNKVPARALSQLPLDFLAAGPSYLYARDSWGPKSMVVHLQLGRPSTVGHEHIDWGSFQLWRGGHWLSRESVGYGESIADWQGGAGKATVSSGTAIAHNTILFEGLGARSLGERRGSPKVIRLESRPDYAYAAVDLGDSYRCAKGCEHPERDDNPHAAALIREYLFVRRLQALVVFDRALASGEAKPADQVSKTFVFHAEAVPKPAQGGLVVPLGDQTLRAWSILPSDAHPRIVSEGGPVGQFRVEIDGKGRPLTHFLTVFQGKGSSDRDLVVTSRETDADVSLTLADAAKGSATIVFTKGSASKGGRFAFAQRGGSGALAPLTEAVQQMDLTAAGPSWR